MQREPCCLIYALKLIRSFLLRTLEFCSGILEFINFKDQLQVSESGVEIGYNRGRDFLVIENL